MSTSSTDPTDAVPFTVTIPARSVVRVEPVAVPPRDGTSRTSPSVRAALRVHPARGGATSARGSGRKWGWDL